jgi:hypothetical protein
MTPVHGANFWWSSHLYAMFGTDTLQLNHACTVPPNDILLQHDQASAVLPVIQQKYLTIFCSILGAIFTLPNV